MIPDKPADEVENPDDQAEREAAPAALPEGVHDLEGAAHGERRAEEDRADDRGGDQMPEYERGHQEEQHAEQRVDPPAVGSRAVNVAANGDNLSMGHIRLLFPVDHGCLPSRHREGP